MIFHEIYGCYYRTVAKAICLAQKGELTEKRLTVLCRENAFTESFLAIVPAIKEQHWQLIDGDYRTPLRHAPTMPLTELEKRWLKAITLDSRFRLFGVEPEGLENVEPLFTPEDFTVYDRYADGDPYDDADYIARFQTILKAIREKKQLSIDYESRKSIHKRIVCRPRLLEYSEKDDKFRLILTKGDVGSINLQRISKCEIIDRDVQNTVRRHKPIKQAMVCYITDERNALERAMLHFAHFEKEAERMDDKTFKVTLQFYTSDETELLIRILSFGPLIRVTEPESMVESIKERLKKQIGCGL